MRVVSPRVKGRAGIVAGGLVKAGVGEVEELSSEAEGRAVTDAVPDAWEVFGVVTFRPPGGFSGLESEESFGNADPASLSYTKLNVTGKNGTSPDAALWT